MELQHLAVDHDGARTTVRLSGNPLSLAEAHEVSEVFDDLRQRRHDLRVVVLASRGADFCPGMADDLDPLRCGFDPAASIAGVSAPVVAALGGRTDSVGLELALAADLRIGTPSSTFALSDLRTGRLPSWGGTQRLPRLAGRGTAARMLLAAAELDADEAAHCGLVHSMSSDLDGAVDEIADQLVALAPLALAAAKEALGRGPELPMRQALELEGDLNHLLQTTSDRAEGLDAFFAKRDPVFEGT